ncbi:MAG TPA: N-acetylmuramoyl-L-alanine amidase [Desulfobacterales bacterium]|nr:N-acetylmuramoyl-L-alanine amidase [Desulfobacterales bacterium]
MNSRLTVCRLTAFFAVFVCIGAAMAGQQTDKTAKRLALAKARLHNLLVAQPADPAPWREVLDDFLALASSPLADRALFLAGRTAEYQAERSPEMRAKAALLYQRLADRLPDSRLADDALFRLAELTLRHGDRRAAARLFTKLVVLFPDGDMAPHARRLLEQLRRTAQTEKRPFPPKQKVAVTDIRHGSTAYYSRVVIETAGPVRYTGDSLPPRGDRPQRLYLDLTPARLPPRLAGATPIGDGVLARVRAAQHDRDTVRVVLDVERLSDYAINTLQDPDRIVIDVWGKRPAAASKGERCATPPSLAEQLGHTGARRIIIDPGHGGRDPGAINRYGVQEKDITLRLAKRLAAYLERQQGYEVHLTRTCDTYIPLEERTAIANRLRGDIFVSLHVNAAASPRLAGIETYYLSLAETDDEKRAAAAENAAAEGTLSDIEAILRDLMLNSKITESARLATIVQRHLVHTLAERYPAVQDLGVKKAPFIVLIGAKMPAVLAEIGFLSNPVEARRLTDDQYLQAVATAIAQGVTAYAGTTAEQLGLAPPRRQRPPGAGG